jgi:hypothetical protein
MATLGTQLPEEEIPPDARRFIVRSPTIDPVRASGACFRPHPKSLPANAVIATTRFFGKEWTLLDPELRTPWKQTAPYYNLHGPAYFHLENISHTPGIFAPSKEIYFPQFAPEPSIATIAATPIKRGVQLRVAANQTDGLWGIAIHRDPRETPPLDYTNCISIQRVAQTPTITWIDSPLEPGSYAYFATAFTEDGTPSAPSNTIFATVS